MKNQSLYLILGVTKEATHDEIKAAYRHLASIHHPDAGGDLEAFKWLQKAAEVLLDPELRAGYDATGSTERKELHVQVAFSEVMVAFNRVGQDDIIATAKETLAVKAKMNEREIKQQLRGLEYMEKRIKLYDEKHASEGHHELIFAAMDSAIERQKAGIDKLRTNGAAIDKAIEWLGGGEENRLADESESESMRLHG